MTFCKPIFLFQIKLIKLKYTLLELQEPKIPLYKEYLVPIFSLSFLPCVFMAADI